MFARIFRVATLVRLPLLMLMLLSIRPSDADVLWRTPVAAQVDTHVLHPSHRMHLPFGHSAVAPSFAPHPPRADLVSFDAEIAQWFPSMDTALLLLFASPLGGEAAGWMPSWKPDLTKRQCDALQCLHNTTLRPTDEAIVHVRRALWACLAAVEDHASGAFGKVSRGKFLLVSVASVRSTLIAYSARFEGLPSLLLVKEAGVTKKVPLPIGAIQSARFTLLRREDGRRMDFEVLQFIQWSTGVRSTMSITSDTGRPVDRANSGRLRVMSFNVWNYNGKWRLRCKAIAALVKELMPSIATLQEVRIDTSVNKAITQPLTEPPMLDTAGHATIRSRGDYLYHSSSQVEHLMRHVRTKIPFFFDFHPAMTYINDEREFQSEGPMLMHRFALLGSFPIFLPRPPRELRERGDDHQRLVLCNALLVLVADGSKVRVDVCTTHFSLTPEAQFANGLDTARALAELARRPVRGLVADHTILTGDLNAEPGHAVLRLLVQGNSSFGVEGYRDAYEYVQSQLYPHDSPTDDPCHKLSEQTQEDQESLGAHGFTFNNADRMTKRIDFVLSRSWVWAKTALCPVRMFHRGHRAVGRDPTSDHVAVLVDYTLTRLGAS